MNRAKLSHQTKVMITMSAMLLVSSILFVSLGPQNAEATICFDCPAEANKHLDEAKKSLDTGDTEGAKKHIDIAQGLLKNSTNK
jgi:hypothetical protein